MERYFARYKRFFGAFFLLWLFLRIAKLFGFSFGVDLHLLFRVVVVMGVMGVMGEIRVNWDKIYPVLKTFFAKQKSNFSAKTKATQAEIVTVSPKILGGRIGSFFVLPLAVAFGVFRGFRGVVKKIFRFLCSREGILFLSVLGILGDIFVLDFTSDLIILLLAGLWIWLVRQYQLEGRVSVAGGLVFLVMCPFLLIFKKDLVAEKAAVWAYVFLVVGTVQMFVESLKRERKDVNLAK